MDHELPIDEIMELTGAESVEGIQPVQSLWSGYGEIVRATLMPQHVAVVVKHVCPPKSRTHKYGWSDSFGHQRKLDSYNNELAWYKNACCVSRPKVRTAELIGNSSQNHRWLFVLEDLDSAGFSIRRNSINQAQMDACLSWLANLHAVFLCDTDKDSETSAIKAGIWPIGTYWHLATRPEEFSSMPNGELKQAAKSIDQVLNECRFQTIVHGDAKLANFCFAEDDTVAAVDFQYVGGGCGMKDVAYFISSCFSENECEQKEKLILDTYFSKLGSALNRVGQGASILPAVEDEWRRLYAFAWADFYRFLAGWSPGHRKMHRYSEELTQQAIAQI